MLTTDQKNKLSTKLLELFPKVSYSQSTQQVRIDNKTFRVPQAPNRTLSNRKNLTR